MMEKTNHSALACGVSAPQQLGSDVTLEVPHTNDKEFHWYEGVRRPQMDNDELGGALNKRKGVSLVNGRAPGTGRLWD